MNKNWQKLIYCGIRIFKKMQIKYKIAATITMTKHRNKVFAIQVDILSKDV